MKNNILTSLFKGESKKKQKKEQIGSVYYSPDYKMPPLWLYVGLLLRTLVTYIGIFGITVFICGAAGLTTSPYWQAVVVSPSSIALICTIPALACGIASLSKLSAVLTAMVYTGGFAAYGAALYGDPVDFTVKSALRVYNYALYTVSLRFHSVGNFMIPDGYDYTTASTALSDPYRFTGTFILATLIGLILFFSVQKKTRVFPIFVLLTAVLAPILTYNIAQGNAGIAFILVFICAALALKAYDRKYSGRAEMISERRARKAKKKEEKAELRKAKKAEKKSLKKEADKVFDRAIDADLPLSRAKKARRAVFRNAKKAAKEKKKADRLEKRLDKKNSRIAKKEKKATLKALKKKLSKLPKASSERDNILALINGENAVRLSAKAEKKEAARLRRQKAKEKAKKRKKVSWAGGYSGAGVALVAFLAVWIPLSTVSEPFREIKVINSRVQTARAYVTAYLKGSDVDLNDPYAYGIHSLAPRELSFDKLELSDDLLFRVDAEGKSNVYMRSWISGDFNWEENKWYGATYEDIYKYRELFPKNFTPDSIKTDFYKYVYPSTTIIEDENTYKNFTKYGFTQQQIDVWRVRGQSLLIFVPAHMDTDIGLLQYSEYAPSPYKYQNYFEGTYSSMLFRYGRGYGTVSFITALNRADVAKSMEDSLTYYGKCTEAILNNPDAEGEEATAIVYGLEQYFAENNIEYQGTSIADRYYFSMTNVEKAEFLDSVKDEDDYYKYVLEHYKNKSENEVIASIAKDIIKFAKKEDKDLTTHDLAMAVSEYFRNGGYTYTESPNSELYDENKSVIEAFLTDVREGYCSHFASSAVFILREMGIPARYAEGYVAKDFEPLGGGYGVKNRADIYGTDAHAWVEVYIEDMGWMQYEVTPGELSNDMYDPNSDTIDPELEEPTEEEEEDPVTTPDIEEEDEPTPPVLPPMEDKANDLEWFIRIVVIALCLALVCALIYFFIRWIHKRAWKVMSARYEVIDLAKNRDAYVGKEFDTRNAARKMNDWILDIFSLIGCEPRQGELPSEFVTRMREDYGDLSKIDIGDVIYAMQKEEFGHGLTFDELSDCAVYLEDIIVSVYAGMNPFQKIINRYFKRKI